MPIDQREHAVDQIPPRGDQLVVVPPQELAPREIAVRGLRHLRRQRVAQRIRVVAAQVVVDPHRPALAGARLATRHRDVLIGRHVERQVVAARAQQNRRPDHRVERHVVLADEVVDAGIRRLPELPPRLWFPARLRPLHRRREVADHRLEPDVDPLLFPSLERHRHPPRDVARDRPILQPFPQHSPREVEHVRPPVLLALCQPLRQRLLKRRQPQEVMLRAAQLRRRPRRPRARIDQIHRVQLPTAGVALIAPRPRVPAVRAGALDVAIRQKPPRFRVVEQLLRCPVEVPVLQQPPEQIVRHLPVVLRHRRRERVE